ncbi:MAG TPA: Type 1 glutamine amidotransferase-like domain-containing protein [Xanthomonadales bacterium]|nr:Type 1 glutamine amidotransferase-like domain-containing protein [Xanthomonadales bacterium]
MSVQTLLGPQSPTPNLKQAMDLMELSGPVVCITAGWRDSEGEIDDLIAEAGQPVEDLMIYHRAQDVFASEPDFAALQRERQDKLLELQQLYRIRLNPTLLAARKLLRMDAQADLLRLEQRAAISQVRALDRHHVRRLASIHSDFDARRASMDIPAATAQREQVHEKLENAGLVLIAGGHVAVLLNRIRLFRLGALLKRKPVIAWSAGAMVLCDRIVLFHDDAPQGKRDAEVLDAGLGIVQNLIPLPHARSRLDWSSRTRMALFSRRFAPAICATLDNGSTLQVQNSRIIAASASSVITRTGRKKGLKA